MQACDMAARYYCRCKYIELTDSLHTDLLAHCEEDEVVEGRSSLNLAIVELGILGAYPKRFATVFVSLEEKPSHSFTVATVVLGPRSACPAHVGNR